MFLVQIVVLVALLAQCLHAQEPIYPQNNTWNSSFTLPPDLASAANLSSVLTHNVEVALNFERTSWAGQSVASDPFYSPPPVNNSTPPGTLLRVEEYTNTTLYTLPPNLALSRILFTSSTLNGTTVPASAYILWPWKAKSFASSSYSNTSGVPIIGWAHGTSGVFGECAPSHARNLWYQFSAPYILALQGYAVVAPDYVGLGVSRTFEGEEIFHQCYANPAHADDVFYAVEAAQKAFSELSEQFVVFGHSQGGGAAWAAAQQQVFRPVKGYLGTVAAAPVSDIVRLVKAIPDIYKTSWRMAQGLKSIFPEFDVGGLLLRDGVSRMRLLQEVQGCNAVEGTLWLSSQKSILVEPGWEDKWYIWAFRNLTSNGHKPISGPMLILDGTADPAVNSSVTTDVVKETCAMYPDSQITIVSFEGATHVPVLNAGQQVWLQWIEDRFSGVEVPNGCQWDYQKPLRKLGAYQKEMNYFLEWKQYDYVVP